MNWLEFYRNKKVLITGHTGFKGTWMTNFLLQAGAEVIGYSLQPSSLPDFFKMCKFSDRLHSVYGDIRDLKRLNEVFEDFAPEIVIHMAAQPLVIESYKRPVYTYDVNVMGTVNVCECIRKSNSKKNINIIPKR